MEHAALGTLWRIVMMGIDYKKELGKDKWANGKFMEARRLGARS